MVSDVFVLNNNKKTEKKKKELTEQKHAVLLGLPFRRTPAVRLLV